MLDKNIRVSPGVGREIVSGFANRSPAAPFRRQAFARDSLNFYILMYFCSGVYLCDYVYLDFNRTKQADLYGLYNKSGTDRNKTNSEVDHFQDIKRK